MQGTNGINGWYFDPEVVAKANRDGLMLTLDFEYGAACRLHCVYCYRTDDSRDQSSKLLSFGQWKKVVDDAKTLGVQSIKLIGGGEITEEERFMEAMEYMANKGIIIVLFTAGTVLGDDELCRRLHGIGSQEMAQWMHDLGMSIFLKCDSLNPELQDKIVGLKGYAAIRDKAFQLLLHTGFDKHDPTRLGLEVNVSSYNIHEIMDIYALRTRYNIYQDIVVSMPCDAYCRNKGYDISIEQKRELYRRIYRFNIEHGISFDGISPFMGGLVCTQLGNGLYVTNRGHVYHCPGAFNCIGNVKTESLKAIWQRFTESVQYHNRYFCPFRENAYIIPRELVDDLESEISTFFDTLPTKRR